LRHGEIPEAVADGSQESLMQWITSANIACGGHAGDAQTMEATIRQAQKHNLAIGAHPGYPDRENFGRIEVKLSSREVADFVFEQVSALAAIAKKLGRKSATSNPTAPSTIRQSTTPNSPPQLQRESRAGTGKSSSLVSPIRPCSRFFVTQVSP